MASRIRILSVLVSAMLILSACNFPIGRGREDDPETLATSVAQTVEAFSTITPDLALPTPQAGEPLVQRTATTGSQPSGPGSPTATPQPCNRAVFVSETIPDDSEFEGGQSFTKSWTLRNEGTCTWNTKYRLVFESGDAMGGPAAVNLNKNVTPNEEITIEVPQKAPANPGTYTGFWRMQAEDNEKFTQVYVRIKVKEPFFAVNKVATNLANVNAGSCPYTYAVEISITASGAGTVTYNTETSDGATSPIQSVKFNEAGTKKVSVNWSGLGVGGATTPYWMRVYIEKPNNQWFGPYNFNVTCP